MGVLTEMKLPLSKSNSIHRQCLHQQVEIIALVREEFVWKVWTHDEQR